MVMKMSFKYKFSTKSRLEIKKILRHELLVYNEYGNKDKNCSYLLFMTKNLDLSLQRQINAIFKAEKKESSILNNLVCSDIAKAFTLSLNSRVYCIPIEYDCNIADICETIRQIFSLVDYKDLDLIIGIYNHEQIYRDGELWKVAEIFDSVLDAKEERIDISDTLSLEYIQKFISFTIQFYDGCISLTSGKKAEKKFMDYYELYYKNDTKRESDIRVVRDFDLHANFEATNFVCLPDSIHLANSITLLEQGKDYLKINFVKDKLVIVFNTDIPDRTLTIFTFKCLLKSIISSSSGMADIGIMFTYRENDYIEAVMDKLIFSSSYLDCNSSKNDKNYIYRLYTLFDSDVTDWMYKKDKAFVDEFKIFMKLLQKTNYEQINEHSYQSLEYKDCYCLGSKEFCSYLVYRY